MTTARDNQMVEWLLGRFGNATNARSFAYAYAHGDADPMDYPQVSRAQWHRVVDWLDAGFDNWPAEYDA